MAADDFDEAKAQRAVNFIETLCTHTKGRWAGVRFKLLPWQKELVRNLYGTVEPDTGLRRYRLCYVEVPKKNGKTDLAAAIALKQLVADDEQGGEVYSAAADKKQANLVYQVAAKMVRNNAVLSKRLRVLDSVQRIIDYKTNSFYQVLSSEAFTKYGLNPSAVIFDELHAQPNRELWDVLVEGTNIAREQQLIFAITTAGIWDPNSICWEVREHARQVAEGIVEDRRVLPVIYGAERDDDWEDEKVWRRVNPSLGVIFDIENLREHWREVIETPARQNNFRRFRLNQWVSQVSRYIPMDAWDACAAPVDPAMLLKRPCYGGLDLSSSLDLTAFVLLFPPDGDDEKWRVLVKCYVPEENIPGRVKRDRVPYDLWMQAGQIIPTPGNVVDYAFIRRDVNNAAKIYDLRELAYDSWGAVKLASKLQDEDGIPMVEFRQGWKSMSPPTKELLKLVKSGALAHGGHKVLRWCADNLVVKIDAAENVKPEKDKARERIDGIVALIMALGRAMLAKQKRRSVYEDRGLVSL